MNDNDTILYSIAEIIYEWEMARDGWEEVKNFSKLFEDVRKDYIEIAQKVIDIYESFLDEELDEDIDDEDDDYYRYEEM